MSRKFIAHPNYLSGELSAYCDLEDAFAWREQRRLSQSAVLQYDKVIFIVEPSEPAKAAIGKK